MIYQESKRYTENRKGFWDDWNSSSSGREKVHQKAMALPSRLFHFYYYYQQQYSTSSSSSIESISSGSRGGSISSKRSSIRKSGNSGSNSGRIYSLPCVAVSLVFMYQLSFFLLLSTTTVLKFLRRCRVCSVGVSHAETVMVLGRKLMARGSSSVSLSPFLSPVFLRRRPSIVLWSGFKELLLSTTAFHLSVYLPSSLSLFLSVSVCLSVSLCVLSKCFYVCQFISSCLSIPYHPIAPLAPPEIQASIELYLLSHSHKNNQIV